MKSLRLPQDTLVLAAVTGEGPLGLDRWWRFLRRVRASHG